MLVFYTKLDRFALTQAVYYYYKTKHYYYHISMPSLAEEGLESLCKKILHLDNSIRFAGIANNLGSLVATGYRAGLIPLMNKQETSHNAIHHLSVINFKFFVIPF